MASIEQIREKLQAYSDGQLIRRALCLDPKAEEHLEVAQVCLDNAKYLMESESEKEEKTPTAYGAAESKAERELSYAQDRFREAVEARDRESITLVFRRVSGERSSVLEKESGDNFHAFCSALIAECWLRAEDPDGHDTGLCWDDVRPHLSEGDLATLWTTVLEACRHIAIYPR